MFAEVKQRWFQMPAINFQHIEQVIRIITYKEKMDQYGHPFEPEEDYSEEDEY